MKKLIILFIFTTIIGLVLTTRTACGVGLAGYALQFDGSNDYVHVPASEQLAFGGAITLEAWVKIGQFRTDASFITRGDNIHNHGQYSLKLSKPALPPGGERLDLDFNDQVWDGGDEIASIGTLPLDEWVHVAATFEGTTARFFINGDLDSEQDLTVRDNTNSYEVYFGFDPPGADEYFKGLIDEMRVWNIARGTDEIAAWYNRAVEFNTPGLIGYWNFDEGDGQTTHDWTINANHGILGSSGGPDVNDPTWIPSGAPIIPEPSTLSLVGLAFVVGMGFVNRPFWKKSKRV